MGRNNSSKSKSWRNQNLLGLDIKCRARGEANLEAEGRSDKFIRFYGSKQRVADTNDASLLLSVEQRAQAKLKSRRVLARLCRRCFVEKESGRF